MQNWIRTRILRVFTHQIWIFTIWFSCWWSVEIQQVQCCNQRWTHLNYIIGNKCKNECKRTKNEFNYSSMIISQNWILFRVLILDIEYTAMLVNPSHLFTLYFMVKFMINWFQPFSLCTPFKLLYASHQPVENTDAEDEMMRQILLVTSFWCW